MQFEIAAEMNEWTMRQKAMEWATGLVGAARGILADLDPHERLDYDALVAKLTASQKISPAFIKLSYAAEGNDGQSPSLN